MIMKEGETASIEGFGWYVLRSPLLPINKLKLDESLIKVKENLSNKLFQEALFIASADLHEKLNEWLSDAFEQEKESLGKSNLKLLLSVLKYYFRASYRCTPFGLFAGVSAPARFAQQSQMVLSDVKRYNRIDAEYLFLTPSRSNPLYYPNTTIYNYGQHLKRYYYRFAKFDPTERHKGVLYQYHLASIEGGEELDTLLDFAKAGRTKQALTQQLEELGIATDDAQEFVQACINDQILIGEQGLSLVGNNYQERVLDKTLLDRLKQAKGVEDYQRLVALLPNLQPYQPKRLLQVDTIRETYQNQLSKKVFHRARKTVETLKAVVPGFVPDNLDRFKSAFIQKFGETFVNLTHALDAENGIVYPHQSLKKPHALIQLPFEQTKKENNPNDTYFNTKWQNFLLDIHAKSLMRGGAKVQLNGAKLREKLEEQRGASPSLPHTFAAMVSLLPNDSLVLWRVNSGAASLLGRFCHASPDMLKAVQEITNHEQTQLGSEVICAEVDHAPAHPRLYNVLNRPNDLRQYRILLSSSIQGQSLDDTLLASDLLVGIVQGEVVLWSTKHQKRVIPQLTTAHNHQNSNYPLYNLLCDLANQNTSVPNWSWGTLDKSHFLPRVEIDGVVVSPARWRIESLEDIDLLNVPQKVLMCEFDNKLPIDRQCHWAR
jgi:hypothetical protein